MSIHLLDEALNVELAAIEAQLLAILCSGVLALCYAPYSHVKRPVSPHTELDIQRARLGRRPREKSGIDDGSVRSGVGRQEREEEARRLGAGGERIELCRNLGHEFRHHLGRFGLREARQLLAVFVFLGGLRGWFSAALASGRQNLVYLAGGWFAGRAKYIFLI